MLAKICHILPDFVGCRTFACKVIAPVFRRAWTRLVTCSRRQKTCKFVCAVFKRRWT